MRIYCDCIQIYLVSELGKKKSSIFKISISKIQNQNITNESQIAPTQESNAI